MINNQLLDYVKQQVSLSVSKETIIANLKAQGWTDSDINEAYESIAQPKMGLSSTFIQKNKKLLSTVLVLIVVFLAGAGVYAYYSGYFVSFDDLSSRAFENLKSSRSARYDTTISADFSEIKDMTNDALQLIPGLAPTKVSFTVKGSYDFSNIANKKISSLISLNAGEQSVLSADLRVVENIFYGQLIKLPDFGPMFSISGYQNRWFSFPLKTENVPLSIDGSINEILGISSDVIDKITPEQKEQINQITQNASFLKMIQKLPPETINGELSYHFSFDLDREGISEYFRLLKEYITSIGKNDSKLSSFDVSAFSDDLDKIKDFKGEIWIGRRDTLPYKMTVNFNVKPDENKNEKMKIGLVSIFSNWNQPELVVAPSESTSLEELFSDYKNLSF